MGCQAGCLRVLRETHQRWPNETFPPHVSPSGCYNPNSFLDGTRIKGPHAKGEAIDVGIRPAFRGRHSTGQAIFLFFHRYRYVLGITQLIWDAQIWSAWVQPLLIRPYQTNPHRDHIHAEFDPAYARNPALSINGLAPTQPSEDDEMTADEKARLKKIEDQLEWVCSALMPGGYKSRTPANAEVLRADVRAIKKKVGA